MQAVSPSPPTHTLYDAEANLLVRSTQGYATIMRQIRSLIPLSLTFVPNQWAGLPFRWQTPGQDSISSSPSINVQSRFALRDEEATAQRH